MYLSLTKRPRVKSVLVYQQDLSVGGSGGPRVPVTVHTESSPEEEITNMPGLSGNPATILVPDHVDPLIWEGKARNGLKISARVYKGDRAARGGLAATKPTVAGKSSSPLTVGASSVVPKPIKKVAVTYDDDEDDDDDDDDDEYKALIRRSSHALSRRVGVAPAGGAKLAGERIAVVTVPGVGGVAVGHKAAQVGSSRGAASGFQDSCKETGELVAMNTGDDI